MSDLRSEAARLKDLLTLKATPERVAEVRSALSSKWEGIQSLAMQVMARWGGREAKDHIRAFLVDAFERQQALSIRGVAIEALAAMVGPQDSDWVLDLYFSRPNGLEKHELLPLVASLPVDRAKPRLVRELAGKDPLNRCAAVKAIGRMPFPDRSALLGPLRFDADKEVRASARILAGEP